MDQNPRIIIPNKADIKCHALLEKVDAKSLTEIAKYRDLFNKDTAEFEGIKR